MERNYRLVSITHARCEHHRLLMLGIGVALLLGLVCGCSLTKRADFPGHADAERVPVLINLAVAKKSPGNEHTADDITDVRDVVLDRLRELIPPEDFNLVRSFRLVPVIAVTVDAETITRLLRMPEVQSIQLDREMQELK